ncbi:hypothetical protein Gogos_002521 [Gossypium gossypioides]|uniref:PGG domain-containing protein n=1 Tax=Gossypium gossypioides TaxID=34282 RepID=A0A7J9CRZ5_GOSGO|nr:hypothetical protein [Gossypium gossypioides]
MTPLLMAARQGHEQTVRKILFHCPACCEKVDKRGWNLLHFLAFRDRSLELILSFIITGDAKYKYGSIKNLMDWKDASGITPQQVCDAYQGEGSCKSKNDQRKMKEVEKLLKGVAHEKVAELQVSHIPLPTISAESLEKTRDAHLVVVALIATVTFLIGITVPGGLNSEKGSEQGTPFLIDEATFKVAF